MVNTQHPSSSDKTIGTPSDGSGLPNGMTFLNNVLDNLSPPEFPGGSRGLPDDKDLPIRVGDFNLMQRLGGGGFGAVYLARHIGMHSQHAVKLLGSRSNPKAEQDELDGLRQVFGRLGQHANLLPCQLPQRDEKFGVYYAMDLADPAVRGANRYDPATLAGELAARQWPNTYSGFLELALALCGGAEHMHGRRVAHCDIKAGNIVKNGGVWRLADFGLATRFEDGRARGYTNRYSPPAGSAAHGSLERFDLACIGATLFESALNGDAWGRLRSVRDGSTDGAFLRELDSSPSGRQAGLLRFGNDSGRAVDLIQRLRGEAAHAFTAASAACSWINGEIDRISSLTQVVVPPHPSVLERLVEFLKQNKTMITAACVVGLCVVAVWSGRLIPEPVPALLPTGFSAEFRLEQPAPPFTSSSVAFSQATSEKECAVWEDFGVTTTTQLIARVKTQSPLHVLLLAVNPTGEIVPVSPASAEAGAMAINRLRDGKPVRLNEVNRAYEFSEQGWHALILVVSAGPLRPLAEWRGAVESLRSPGDGLDGADSPSADAYFFDGERPWPVGSQMRGDVDWHATENQFSRLCQMIQSQSVQGAARAGAAPAVRGLLVYAEPQGMHVLADPSDEPPPAQRP